MTLRETYEKKCNESKDTIDKLKSMVTNKENLIKIVHLKYMKIELMILK